eukprot:CAMPEP_0114278956 /NCGR_PEP_ID=MMETSP0059-20121206/1615_1 /TAXON_ID=36894 /ORGANISM="Pyramimonas parkeae, Strain CCMP726" /LENGTH=148 /DNA_ID=CAMNT_0001399193 /DNA_START=755 /DNA_END=1201 /DNA_ORIENTATION=-
MLVDVAPGLRREQASNEFCARLILKQRIWNSSASVLHLVQLTDLSLHERIFRGFIFTGTPLHFLTSLEDLVQRQRAVLPDGAVAEEGHAVAERQPQRIRGPAVALPRLARDGVPEGELPQEHLLFQVDYAHRLQLHPPRLLHLVKNLV